MILVCFGSFEPSNKNGIVKIFFTMVFKCGSEAMDSSVQVPVDRLVSMAQPAGLHYNFHKERSKKNCH